MAFDEDMKMASFLREEEEQHYSLSRLSVCSNYDGDEADGESSDSDEKHVGGCGGGGGEKSMEELNFSDSDKGSIGCQSLPATPPRRRRRRGGYLAVSSPVSGDKAYASENEVQKTNNNQRRRRRLDSSEDETEIEIDDEDDYCLTDGKTEELIGVDGVLIEVKKLEKSSRRIRSKIGMEVSLDSVWSVLTDYEKLSDFIPGLVVSELVEKEGNRVRLFQMGQQNLALGLKFNAKAVLDCFEKELEILPHGRRREIDFKMVEGDFQLFEGKWSIEQLDKGIHGESLDLQFKDFRTTLAYTVDVKPKMWLPVRLVEGRLCKEIKTNLTSIRDAAQKVIEGVIHDL
ncbi:Coenzyme Q-binding protein COQ10 START domain [Arabidopsis suecica]|uniref:Coenzyme Q-binding protein COQ10 START domain n=1 Tax=Arabidopsis suecica TaxID=45249 RepID=A0A8T1ZID0_ARASU|nr:Coenzyme Q-binding protein COQ10 START domain [Arabidopsis suecica]